MEAQDRASSARTARAVRTCGARRHRGKILAQSSVCVLVFVLLYQRQWLGDRERERQCGDLSGCTTRSTEAGELAAVRCIAEWLAGSQFRVPVPAKALSHAKITYPTPG